MPSSTSGQDWPLEVSEVVDGDASKLTDDPHHRDIRRHGVFMAIRYVGILLPLALTYWLALPFGLRRPGSLLLLVSIVAAVTAAFVVLLATRRDFAGAGVVFACYVIIDGWLWLPALGALGLG